MSKKNYTKKIKYLPEGEVALNLVLLPVPFADFPATGDAKGDKVPAIAFAPTCLALAAGDFPLAAAGDFPGFFVAADVGVALEFVFGVNGLVFCEAILGMGLNAVFLCVAFCTGDLGVAFLELDLGVPGRGEVTLAFNLITGSSSSALIFFFTAF